MRNFSHTPRKRGDQELQKESSHNFHKNVDTPWKRAWKVPVFPILAKNGTKVHFYDIFWTPCRKKKYSTTIKHTY